MRQNFACVRIEISIFEVLHLVVDLRFASTLHWYEPWTIGATSSSISGGARLMLSSVHGQDQIGVVLMFSELGDSVISKRCVPHALQARLKQRELVDGSVGCVTTQQSFVLVICLTFVGKAPQHRDVVAHEPGGFDHWRHASVVSVRDCAVLTLVAPCNMHPRVLQHVLARRGPP